MPAQACQILISIHFWIWTGQSQPLIALFWLNSPSFFADNHDMNKKSIILFALFVTVFAPFQLFAQSDVFKQEGIASWYGREYDGRPTASGEIYDSSQFTAAHPDLPFGTMLVITNQHNNKKVTVRVNDRGPFVAARVIDISRAAAEQLDMIATGTAPVTVESLDRIVISAPAQQQPVVQAQSVVVQPVITQPATQPVVQPVVQPIAQPEVRPVAQPVIQPSFQFKLTPATINIDGNKNYRFQLGSFRVARNAVDTFDRLKNAGLNPAYERHDDERGEFFRVVLAGISGANVYETTEKLKLAGFREALIREEN
jgi:rare lipoprotein A